MALTARTLTGSLLDVQGVPKGANVQQAWIGSSKATIVDAPSTVRVGRIVPLALSGAGAFSVSLPDSAEAGVLYSLWATWVEPTGTRRQAGPTQLGTFHLTANATIGTVLETSDGQIPQSTADALGARLTAAEGKLVPAGTTTNTILTWVGPGAHDYVWGNPATAINFEGVLESTDDLPATGTAGHGWVIDGDLWLWVTDQWTNVGGFQGPPGVPGLGLPDPAGLDGKVAFVEDGVWVAGDMPDPTDPNLLLPAPTVDGKTVLVVDGAWVLVDPPEGGGGGVSTDPDGIGYLDLTGGGISPTPDDNGYLDL